MSSDKLNYKELSFEQILAYKINELQIEMIKLKAEFAATKVKLDHLEATVNHEE